MAPRKINDQLVFENKKMDEPKRENFPPRNDDDVIMIGDNNTQTLLDLQPGPSKRGRKPRLDKIHEEIASAMKKAKAMEAEVNESPKKQPTNVFEYPTIFWKLAKPKYGVFTFMCNECRDDNFRQGNSRFKLINQNGEQQRLEFTQSFCQDCAKLNFDCTDLIIKHKKKDDPATTTVAKSFRWIKDGANNTPGFVGNKTNKFKVHLPKKLVFDGAGWMVGLSGIIYPNSWAKLGTSDRQYVIVHLHDGRKYRFRVPKGSFLSPQQLERGLHHGMIAELERLLTRKRSAPVHTSFGNADDDDEEEGEILDVSFVEEEEENTGEAPLYPLSNLTKLSAEQETLRHEKRAQEERRRKEEEQRKQREAERKRREEEEKRRKAEDDRRKAAEKTAKENKAKEEKEASEKKAREEKLAREKKEAQRIAKEKKGEKEALGKKAEVERVAKAEADRVAKAEAERVAKAEAERVAKETKAEEERVAKAEADRVSKAEAERVAKAEAERVAKEEEERLAKEEEERAANKTKKKQEEEKQSAELQRQQLATRKQKELELLKEFRPWRGGYMRLVHGKDPTPDVHYLHETDDYHFVNAVHKYRVRHSELPWEAPEFNPSAHIQQNIAEFRELFEQEVYDENYAVKTREEKEELIELVKGFRFYFTEQIGRFELKVFNGKISHITLTDQLAYVLGYEQEQEIRNEELAKYAVDLGGGVSHLCIYLNSGVIESMIVGNTFANLLQVIAVEGKSGSVVEKDFQSPLFHKIIAREVDVLDVEIRTLTGREMVRVIFDGSNLRLEQIYQQNGGGVNVFEGAPTFQRGYGYFLGVPRQKGAGVGSVLRNLWRYLRPMVSAARPYAANIAAEIGKEGLETGARFLNEVSKGGNIKDALVSEGKEGAKKLLDKASSSLQKGSGRRKRRGGRKKAEIILKPSDIHPITSYVDLSKVFVCTEFKLKKVADDGVVVDVPANAAVGLIQMPGATFIRNLKVHINQREVYDSNQLYSYKVFLDTELSYPVAAKEAYFGVAGYFRDSDPTKVNDRRKKAEAANRDKYTLEVVDCRLIVKTVDLMDGLSLDIAKKLDMEPARYGIRKTLMKSLFITGGRYDFSANLFTEEVPRRVIIGLVPNQNYIGHNQKNPFYFNHHNVRDIELTASGRTYPQFPYNLDYKNNRYARAYHDTQEHLGMACTTESNGISYSMFKTAYCLYVFQMTNSQEDSPGFELIKEGCTAVNIRFAEAVPNEGVTLIAYADMSGENYSSDFVQMPSSNAVHEGIVLCFPDVIEKSPINFFLCLIYLFGAAGTAVAGFYLFLRERRIRRRNGQSVHRQNTL
ncbi:hypothetical protein niasHS_011911 [Heterodera schachtii]|uniref:Uncharacterized protein n=1 Tax=Heterodera schachtii TaxID=97005 RepID=A0ABD2IPF9_HETSC